MKEKRTDKEIIADLEKKLAATTKDLETASQQVESFKQAQEQSTDRKLFLAEKATKHFILGPKLKESLIKLLKGDASKDNIADVLTAVLYRFTRIGVFAMLVAIIPIAILMIQTVLLSRQNDKLDRQNYRLDQQTALLEADRRSAVIFESGNVLDAISRELADDGNTKDSLSNPLIGRIIALSRAMKPYRYLDPDTDTIIARSISPERGHLLVALHEASLDSETIIRINKGADFNHADLNKAELQGAVLSNAMLQSTDLSGANLSNADLREVYFNRADLRRTRFSEANLDHARLYQADLRRAIFTKTNLFRANLIETDLRGAFLKKADLRRAILNGADLRHATFEEANFEGARLNGAIALKSSMNSFLELKADTTEMIWLDE